jgi:hypothetical protein
MDDLCDSLISEVLSHVAAADRWLLRTVCRRFRRVVAAETVDPRRRRVLDDVLNRAISGGGLATVRALWGRPSCVWATAVERAAARGDLEMVRFLALRARRDDDDEIRGLCAALAGRHVDVAEFLWSRRKRASRAGRGARRPSASRATLGDFERLLLASAESASRAMLEWTVAKDPCDNAMASWTATAINVFVCACKAGDADSVRYICDTCDTCGTCGATDGRSINSAFSVHDRLYGRFVPLSTDAAVLRFLHDRYGYAPSPSAVARSANNHGALAFLLETGGDRVLGELLRVPAHESPDLHAFLRSAGHRVELDLATTALAVSRASWRDGSVGQMEALMLLRPDPAEWVAELGPMLKTVLETDRMQASLAKFFKGHRFETIDFEITDAVPADTFADLRAMGGSCGRRTFLTTIRAPNTTVEHARAVWAAISDDVQKQLRQGCMYWVPDVDVLKFAVQELGMRQRCDYLMLPAAATWSRCVTPELARVLLEHQIKSPAAVLDLAATCGHLDVVKLVTPACTTPDLRQCLSRLQWGPPSEVQAFILHSIIDRTHPMLGWLEKLKLKFNC